MNINDLLKTAVERGSSDLHLKVGVAPMMRIDGRLVRIEEKDRLSSEDIIGVATELMNPVQKERFNRQYDIDLAHSVPGVGRFRVNVFKQRGTVGVVFRIIPMKILTIEELNLPPVLEKLALEPRGLILVTGTTGSGKSTTLASMIEHINNHRTVHIVTIEDPIEYLFRDKKSLINQREVGFDTTSFNQALKYALRQDPDVIMVGEMRDFETISTAIIAAETGHLVMSTLHTTDATETINRIISVFPPYQQQQIRIQLASVLKGILSMRLVPRADGKGRVPAVEVLLATTTIKESIIEKEKTKQIPEVMAAGVSQYSMQTFDQALMNLYIKELISYEEALKRSTNPDDFALKVRGIESTSDLEWAGSGQVPGTESSEDKGVEFKDIEDFKIDKFGDQ
jgi:twitching motility protein PilT